MPTLKQLRYFLAVVDHGGFTQAAAALFVAQSALSRHIGQLEDELGFVLLEREPRGVRPTPAGALYRERIRPVDALLLAAAEEGAQLARGEAGVLRLLHSSSTPAKALLPAIARLLEASPGARVELDRVASELQPGEIAAGRADIGIVRLPLLGSHADVQFVELAPERLWAALPEGHPLAAGASLEVAQLRGLPFVSAVHRERGGLARLVTDLCLARGFVPGVARALSRKTSMLDLVAAGFGIAVVPDGMTAIRPPGVRYVALADEDARARRALVMPGRATVLARTFAEEAAAG